jgi:hypothetical protein
MNTAKCRKCGEPLSLILSPFEKFAAQSKRLFDGFCSALCEAGAPEVRR